MPKRMLAVSFFLLFVARIAIAHELPTLLTSEPLEVKEDADPLQKLLVERYNAAVDELKIGMKMYQNGIVSYGELIEPALHIRDASLELSDDPQDQIAALEKFVEFARFYEKVVQAQIESGRNTPNALQAAKYLRLDGEVKLLRLQRAAEKKE